ncbi:hypothetical protein C1646_776316 [Rhizophagus diaphanus]|nr:hypothetical protein C1646_776316 [Rhizophagus diaphanus] [Rhizophagus sp. MUCL 43196]
MPSVQYDSEYMPEDWYDPPSPDEIYMYENPDVKPLSDEENQQFFSHLIETRSAQKRQTVCKALATLKGVQLQEISYPCSNAKMQEYKEEIHQIREVQVMITNEEITRMMQIDPDPHYEVIFICHDQVRIGKELTDSNFIADIAIGTPGEDDYALFLSAHSQTIQNILQDE